MKKQTLILGLVLALSTCLPAEEGMWLLTQLKNLNLKKDGLKINVTDIYNPNGVSLTAAIVNLGGASAELVSADGLLLTNHHVAFGAVQRASILGDDYITKGFLAQSRSEEIPAHGSTARILLELKDVSDEVLQSTQNIEDPLLRQRAIKTKIRTMTETIENGRDDITARVAEMYEGKQYILYIQQSFEDVRLVYVPPQSIGNYGGDIDNWMWPRHTGDFAFMRVYMAPDGRGRKYHKENVPYRPKNWLKIAQEPLKEGDFTFILGFPGSTNRYQTSFTVDYYFNYYYPNAIKNYKEIIDLLETIGETDPLIARKVSGFIKGLNNSMKNYQGNIDGMKTFNFLEKKKTDEKELMDFIANNTNLKIQYHTVLSEIEKQYTEMLENKERSYILASFGRMAGTLPGIANRIVYSVNERSKPEADRDPAFSEQSLQRSLQRLRFTYMNYDESVDKILLKRILTMAKELPASSRIKSMEYIFQNYSNLDAFIDSLYEKTKLTDLEYVKEMCSKTREELKNSSDALLVFAQNLYPDFEEKRLMDEQREATLSELSKKYIEMLSLCKTDELYPDANGTIRFTYGKVSGYSPRDALYFEPFTSLTGVIEKNTGRTPFDAPSKLLELHTARDYGKWIDPVLKDVPVAFIHECDITGGNSGSPVMNAKGELIGIAFDGNYEALIGDWDFMPEIQRTISVDIRYVLFITEKFAGADYLLKELGVN